MFRKLAMVAAAIAVLALPWRPATAETPLIDVHIHYSHDAWDMLPPAAAVKALRDAGLKRAFVSSSNDDGTLKLHDIAPDLIVPVLRPYRRRGELSTWHDDPTVVDMIAERLEKRRYAGIGEFHIFGADADKPVMRAVVELAKKHKIFLHAHSDADAVDRIFRQNPDARVLWAHSGFAPPEEVTAMLAKYPNLWADLAFRSEHAYDGKIDFQWRKAFLKFPERFMIGTDTFAPERWSYVSEHADWSRGWLADLPQEAAMSIAYRNAETLAKWALGK